MRNGRSPAWRTLAVAAHGCARGLILVLTDGEIVEQGRYGELLLRDGPFARLARAGKFLQTETDDDGELEKEESVRPVPRAASA